MSKHLTDEQIAHGIKRLGSTEEWIATDDHVSQCAECRERLAQAWDMKAALHRSTAAVSSNERKQWAEHLTFEQLEASINGKLAAAEEEAVEAHTRVCPPCAEELRDLQTFKQKLADSAQGAEISRQSGQPAPVIQWPVLLRVAAVIVVATAAAAAFLWVKKMHPGPASIAGNNPAGNPGSNASPSVQGPNALAVEIASLQPDDQRAVRQAIEHGEIALPQGLAELRGNEEILMGESAGNQFQVLEPAGEAVLSSRPLFRWQPLKGAQSYSVVVFDSKLNAVQTSPALRETSWNPSHALKQGQVYEWQVTAKTADGNSIIAPAPPHPEAKFLVLEKKKADEFEQFQRSHPNDHLVLGILYAQAGVLPEAARELKQIPPSDPNYNLARKLLTSLEERRPHQGI